MPDYILKISHSPPPPPLYDLNFSPQQGRQDTTQMVITMVPRAATGILIKLCDVNCISPQQFPDLCVHSRPS